MQPRTCELLSFEVFSDNMETKIILVQNDDFSEINKLLFEGYRVQHISAVGTGYQTSCYIVLEKAK